MAAFSITCCVTWPPPKTQAETYFQTPLAHAGGVFCTCSHPRDYNVSGSRAMNADMTRFLPFVFLFVLALTAPAQAGSPVLVELFSSGNCKASDRAHQTLKQVDAEHDDVLILTWPVSYWDYLGDADPMALDASKARQAAYVDRFALRGLYTPQTVYNGTVQCPGNKMEKVSSALANASVRAESGVSLSKAGDLIELTGTPPADAEVLLITYLPGKENTTGMINPVVDFDVVSAWSGGDAVFKTSICKTSCALVVQQAGQGAVLAALDIAQ